MKNTTLPEEVNFNDFKYPPTDNYFFVVPLDLGFKFISQPESPVFDCPVDELEAAWKTMIAKQPRTTLRSFSKEKRRYHYLCKTFVWHFPDYLIVQFLPVDEQHSTVAMYSYSVYGYSDFGKNRSRIFKLLIKLKKQLNKSH
jgi:uncharacterized protein (DUF1499 family)